MRICYDKQKGYKMKHSISIILITLLLLSGCSQKNPTVQTDDNRLSTSEKIGGVTGGVLFGAGGAMVGGMMGFLVSGGTSGVAPVIGIIVGGLTGAGGGASLGILVGKAVE